LYIWAREATKRNPIQLISKKEVISMKKIQSTRFYCSPLALMLLQFLVSTSAFAFRTDHGFLPEGQNICEAHVPITLEVPPNAQPVPDPGEFSHGFYHIQEIDDGLFYMAGNDYFSLFLVSEEGIIVVDAPPAIGQDYNMPSRSINIVDVIYSIPETQGKPIKKLIYSHTHMDHIGAASFIKDAFPEVDIIAHQLTKKQLKRGNPDREGLLVGVGSNPAPLPTEVFSKETEVELGGHKLYLSYKGPAHEPGNIFIYIPEQKVLMLVDIVFPGWSPFSNLALAEEVPEYLEAHEEILEYDFDIFVGGHHNRLGTRADIKEAQQYFMDIKENALTAIRNPAFFEIFGVVPKNSLGAFTIYLDQLACDCANRTLNPETTPSGTDWRSRLANADVGTLSHCWTMSEFLRIDPTF